MNEHGDFDPKRTSLGAQPTATPSSGVSLRGRLILWLSLIFLSVGAFCLGYWALYLRLEESTDDAYVAGNIVRISSLVSGSVQDIFVENNQAVTVGQVLARLDSTDAELALERARSALIDAVNRTRSLMAESDRLTSVVELRRQELEKAEGNLFRRANRKTAMSVSEEELSHARDDLDIARIALRVAEQNLLVNQMLLRGKDVETQPQVLLRAHELREAWLALQRCDIKSPVNGHVARRAVQVGAHVAPDTALMAVAPLDEVWVDANFKEVQLARMRIGQPAVAQADMYGNSVTYQGTVQGFSAGTGGVFSLLPPENATGNWIKVVQRVPVRIALNRDELRQAPLLVGLSCTVHVDIGNSNGTLLAPFSGDATENPLYSTTALQYDLTPINTEIQAIISDR